MYYYKRLDEDSNVLYLLTYNQRPNIGNPLTFEITEAEYNELIQMLEMIESYALQVYKREIVLEEVPEELYHSVEKRAEEMNEEFGEK